MKRFIVFAALGSLLAAPLAYAGPPHWTPPGHRRPPPPTYGYYYPAYHYHGHGRDGDSDDAAWAIGGLVLGAIIGTAAARAESREAPATESSSAPLRLRRSARSSRATTRSLTTNGVIRTSRGSATKTGVDARRPR